MYFTKTIVAPNDATIEFHRIVTVTLEQDTTEFNLLVHSWASEAAQQKGYDPLWRELYQVPIDGPDYSKGFAFGLVEYVLNMDGKFKDATTIARQRTQ